MSEINYEIISQYLDGELTGDALAAFEKQMQENADLAAEVNIYKTIEAEQTFNIKHRAEKENLTSSLHELNKTYFKKNEAKVVTMNRWWYAAAAVAAAVILIFVIRPFGGEAFNNEKLFAYYSKNVEPLSAGQRGAKTDTLELKAVDLFNKKDYAGSLPLLKKVLAEKPNETDLLLANGISFLQVNQTDSALRIFNIIAEGNTVYKKQAIWYKALVLLKQNNLNECYIKLESLPPEADNYKEAKELMKKIKAR